MNDPFLWRPFVETPWREPSNRVMSLKFIIGASALWMDRPECRPALFLPSTEDLMEEVTDLCREVYKELGNRRKDLRRLRRWKSARAKRQEALEIIERTKTQIPKPSEIRKLQDFAKNCVIREPELAHQLIEIIASIQKIRRRHGAQ